MERGTRTRTLTEKGLSYQMDIRKKKRRDAAKKVQASIRKIQECIAGNPPEETVRVLYTKWLSEYEEFLECNHQVQEVIDDPAECFLDYADNFEPYDRVFKEFKQATEEWFLDAKPGSGVISGCRDFSYLGTGPRSQRSEGSLRSRSSASSTLSMKRLTEEQAKVEMMVKAEALQEKQSLEKQIFDLKQREEKLKIETAISVAEARSRVIDDTFATLQEEPDVKPDLGLRAQFDVKPKATGTEPKPKVTVTAPTRQNAAPIPQETVPVTTVPVPRVLNVNAKEFEPQLHYQNPQPPVEPQRHSEGPQYFDNRYRNSNVEGVDATMRSVVREMKRPTTDIQKFSGNAIDYKRFVRQFNTAIVQNCDSKEECMNYLLQFTTGEANKIVKGYANLDASVGYRAALDEFDRRYGDPDVIAQAYIQKALDWPVVKRDDPKGLDAYSVFITECNYAVKSIHSMQLLEYPENMKRLVSKLPYNLHDRWRNIALRSKQSGEMVKFDQFVAFVRWEAMKVNDPVYGKSTMPATHAKPSVKVKGLAVDAQEAKSKSIPKPNSVSCLYCNGEHAIGDCIQLKSVSCDKRLEFLKKKGVCFACLRQGKHISKNCNKKLSCEVCRGVHPTLLHREDVSKTPDVDENPKTNVRCVSCPSSGVMSIVPVIVRSKDREIPTYAFIDTGSSASFISEKLMRELCESAKETTLLLSTMGTKEKVVSCSVVSGLEVMDMCRNNIVSLPNTYSVGEIPVSKDEIPKQETLRNWDYLSEVDIPAIDADVGLLIGSNVPKAVEPWEIINSQGDGPYAVRTLLGWSVNGPLKGTQDCQESRISVNAIHTTDLDTQITNYFNLDFVERSESKGQEYSVEDKRFMEKVENSVKFVDGHYQIALPLREDNLCMPNNKPQAMQRLRYLGKRLEGSEQFFSDYKTFMDKLLEKGYAEKVDQSELNRKDGRVWYLPHHGVYNPQKPGKIRVVFDCAAKYAGTSLNDKLLQGPNLTSNLVGVLLRFRSDEVAVTSDIEAMFHQVRVPESDRDLLRFLWWPDGNFKGEPHEYRMCVHLFGATSSPSCCNFALRRIVYDNPTLDESIQSTIERSFYVDDCLKSVLSEESAITLTASLMETCYSGGFHLTAVNSNRRSVLMSIPEEDHAKAVKGLNLDKDKLPLERVLGVQWMVEDDQFGFKIVVKDRPPTRRGLLSIVSSVYDPLGFAAPFVLPAKVILQELCSMKLGFDDEIPQDHKRRWENWLFSLPKLAEFTVKRCLKPAQFGQVKSAEIHNFADASETGYGSVSYLRLINENDQPHCSFLIGKSRVAPLKQTTIPRLELTAATVAARVNALLQDELDDFSVQSAFWSDSMTVIRYIRNESTRFKTFVANRIAAIHERSNPSQWKYVPGELNPADCASRGLSVEQFLGCKEWIEGPAFLWESGDIKDFEVDVGRPLDACDSELKRVCSAKVQCADYDCVDKLIKHHSSWYRLRKSVAWLLRVRRFLLERSKRRKQGISVSGSQGLEPPLTVQDMNAAEDAIIRYAQRVYVSELDDDGKVKRKSPISNLDPFVDHDGILKVGGRLHRANLPYNAKHQVILPKDSHVSRLILDHIHSSVGHSGRNYMLAKLREKYWIVNANSAIRKLIGRCVVCRRLRAKLGEQKMADLPFDRIAPEEPPFTRVGVDYFGPFEVKIGRKRREKRYGVLFTCYAIRAIHIEIAHSLDTSSYICALRRFIARRGQVARMRSDNGTNFIGAERELRQAINEWNSVQIHDSMLQHNVDWCFNTPTASHHGGTWERQIRTLRKVLNSVVREQCLSEEALSTLMCEAEAIVNGRPLTMSSEDPSDLEPLTPNHLLLLKTEPSLPPGLFDRSDSYSRKRWKQVQHMANLFWERWTKEYIPTLQVRSKWTKSRRNFSVGDVVIMASEQSPRNRWPLGRITEVFKDSKGYVRKVKVKTAFGVYERPITKLCLLIDSDQDG